MLGFPMSKFPQETCYSPVLLSIPTDISLSLISRPSNAMSFTVQIVVIIMPRQKWGNRNGETDRPSSICRSHVGAACRHGGTPTEKQIHPPKSQSVLIWRYECVCLAAVRRHFLKGALKIQIEDTVWKSFCHVHPLCDFSYPLWKVA